MAIFLFFLHPTTSRVLWGAVTGVFIFILIQTGLAGPVCINIFNLCQDNIAKVILLKQLEIVLLDVFEVLIGGNFQLVSSRFITDDNTMLVGL